MQYEAYGPGGVAILIDVLTDNKNRAAAEIRHMLTRGGGRLGAKNSVAYHFTSRGQIFVDARKYDEEKVMEAGLEAGAEDIQSEDDTIIVVTSPAQLYTVKEGLEKAGITVDGAESTKVADNVVVPDRKEAEQAARLLEMLEEHDDVQAVHTNLEMPE